MKQIAFLVLTFILFTSYSFPDEKKWELKKKEKGILVYTRLAEGAYVKEVRVVNKVKSTLSAVVGLTLDTPNYPNWIYACSEAKTLKAISDREQYKYQVTKVPWPFSDRDLITDFKIAQNPTTKVVTVNSSVLPNYIPAVDGRVRVEHFHSAYTLTPLPNDSVQVDYELYVDPGGDIPAWLINSNIVMAPFNTTLEMIKQLPKYQSSSFSFIKEK